jgi:hypothetical protein
MGATGLVAGLLGLAFLIGWWGFGWGEYRAYSIIQLYPRNALRPNDYGFSENEKQTQIAIVKSQLVLNKALNSVPKSFVASQSDPIGWLQKNMVVEFASPEILRIGLRGDDPDALVVLVDAIRDAYVSEILDIVRASTEEGLAKLKTLKADYDSEIRAIGRASSEERLARLKTLKADYDTQRTQNLRAFEQAQAQALGQAPKADNVQPKKDEDLKIEIEQTEAIVKDLNTQITNLEIEAHVPSRGRVIEPTRVTKNWPWGLGGPK